MKYKDIYKSPIGDMILTADEDGLTGIRFKDKHRHAPEELTDHITDNSCVFIYQAKEWLNIYFSGKSPDFIPKLHIIGTPFQNEVCDLMLDIPYGKTVTYGELATAIANRRGSAGMSAQAVGGAVGRNPISVIIPCHRVIGSDGSLTGYGGGIERKISLLTLEGAFDDHMYVPKKGTAL